jgi:hypothetical protein
MHGILEIAGPLAPEVEVVEWVVWFGHGLFCSWDEAGGILVLVLIKVVSKAVDKRMKDLDGKEVGKGQEEEEEREQSRGNGASEEKRERGEGRKEQWRK